MKLHVSLQTRYREKKAEAYSGRGLYKILVDASASNDDMSTAVSSAVNAAYTTCKTN